MYIFGCLETLNSNISLNFMTRPASINIKGVKSEGAQLRMYVDSYNIFGSIQSHCVAGSRTLFFYVPSFARRL